jgi:secondary thiamine-phosphate synthase enzyme
MVVTFYEIRLNTKTRKELVDITEKVASAVSQSGLRDGICLVHSTHSTSALVINEDEGGLRNDILKKVSEDYPVGVGWQHDRIDDNADGHLAGTFIGPSITLPVRGGRMILGTWQSIFFLELDGPRTGRRIVVEILGEV